jgi:hypothetical protein
VIVRLTRALGSLVALLVIASLPLAAQQAPALALRGTVRDSTGRALPDVEVSSGGVTTLSDSSGNFRLTPVPLGRISVRFERDGLLLGEVEANVKSAHDSLPDVEVQLTLDRVAPRTFAGTVVDSAGRPVRDATIEVMTAALVARSDSIGAFSLRAVPARAHVVRVRKVGYAPAFLSINLSDTTSSRARVVLRQFAGQNLGLVVVRATRYPVRMRAFLRRAERQSGFGQILTDSQITARHPAETSELFRSMRGVSVGRHPGGATIVTGRGACVMMVFINGFPVPQHSGMGIDDLVSALDIAGIEVYHGLTHLPPDLMMGQPDPCGTIGIWTK